MDAVPQTILHIRVLPRSSRNEIVGEQDGGYKVKLTAPAVEGKANKALIAFLSGRLGLSKTKIEIVSGDRARAKTIRIHGLSPDEVEALLIHPS